MVAQDQIVTSRSQDILKYIHFQQALKLHSKSPEYYSPDQHGAMWGITM